MSGLGPGGIPHSSSRVRLASLIGGAPGTPASSLKSPSPSASPGGGMAINHAVEGEAWHRSLLSIVVIGASGDLAKKKTYPSLMSLYQIGLLPVDFVVLGYARSEKSNEDFRASIRPFLLKSSAKNDPATVDAFLSRCFYFFGASYDDLPAYERVNDYMCTFESDPSSLRVDHRAPSIDADDDAADADAPPGPRSGPQSGASSPSAPAETGGTPQDCNRLFYFAIPANVFAEAARAIKGRCEKRAEGCLEGWTRVIVEKPFGHDSESCEELSVELAKYFKEESLYRIDHYLGKEIVQNLMVMRFSNIWFERLWNRNDVAAVVLTFKEPFGTDGRGGYFDKYGIIRDILQNHLLQVLTLVAMEPPLKVDGVDAGDKIRDMKVNVLKAMDVIKVEDCILGQYIGYTDDPTVPKDSTTPTFACIRCFVNTPRWAGVPFILKAGKALDERKAEVRIQFKDAPAATFMFESPCPRNELVMRLQPKEAIYMKTNVKTPGFASVPIQSELEVDYDTRFNTSDATLNPDAYTRLILDVLRGRTAGFVRRDELVESWKIFTPLLHTIEREKTKPIMYAQGTRGPECCDKMIEDWGYIRNMDYVYVDGNVLPKNKL